MSRSPCHRWLLLAAGILPLVAFAAACGSRGVGPEPSSTPEPTPFPTLTAEQLGQVADKLERAALQAADFPGFEEREKGITTLDDALHGNPQQDTLRRDFERCGRTLGWQQSFVKWDPSNPATGVFEVGFTINAYATSEGAAVCHASLLEQLRAPDAMATALRTVGFAMGMEIGDSAVAEERDYPGIGDDVAGLHVSGKADYQSLGPKDLSMDVVVFRQGQASVTLAVFAFGTPSADEVPALVQRAAQRVAAGFGG